MARGEVGIPLELKQGMSPHLEMRWGTRGSSRVASGNSGFLSSCDGYLREPLELRKGNKAFYQVLRGDLGLLSRRCGKKGVSSHIEGEFRGFSQVAVEVWGSSRVTMGKSGSLLLPQGRQDYFQVARGVRDCSPVTARKSASSCTEVGISLCFSYCSKKLWIPLEFQHGPEGTSQFVSGKSGLLSSYEGHLRIPLQSLLGNEGSHLETRRVTHGSSPVAIGILAFLGVSTGDSDLVSFEGMELNFPLELYKGCQAYCRVQGETCAARSQREELHPWQRS